MVRNPGQLNLENIVTLQILLGSARVRILTDQEVHGLSTVYQFLVLSPHAIARVVLQPDIIEFTVLLDTAVCSGNYLRGVLPWNPELVNACGTVPPAALGSSPPPPIGTEYLGRTTNNEPPTFTIPFHLSSFIS